MPRSRSIVIGEWRDEAICVSMSPDQFYTERSNAAAARAKEVCFTCPVRQECLDEAIQNKERFGVWGGMDTQQRMREMRRRRREAEKRNS